ncbi:MAG: hypothetical protein E7175_00710 [Erysipelotrichaceae bacterium]|nr:hypothetical protein [Erysipelotrichaceae bacterium]
MRKASNMLMIIGFVLGIFATMLIIAFTVFFFIIAGPGYKDELINQIASGSLVTNYSGTVEEQAVQVQALFLPLAIFFLFESIISISYLTISMITRIKRKLPLYIITIAGSALGGNIPLLLGTIFSLVADHQEENVEEINASI